MALDESILVISNAGPLLAGQSLRVVSDQTLSQSNSYSLVDLRAVGGGAEAAANPNAGLGRISTGNAIIGAGGISNVSGVVNISVNTGILSNVSSAASLALNITNMTRVQ